MNLEQVVDYLKRRIEEARVMLEDTRMSSLGDMTYQEGQLDALRAVLENINNDVDSRYQPLCYVTKDNAFEEYESNEVFYSMIEVELNDEHVEYTQNVAKEILKINMPAKDVVKMLSCDAKLAREAFNMTMTDTDARSALMGYLGYELLNLRWPTGGTPKEESDNFFKQWREKIAALGWD